ncbi:N-acetylmuramoyl-L-alanine amidase [Pacificimonas sp. WHA3]|uniref:N-acetylmuramoyl-L-alanine amidase n=1 Tax=Pacificimonas pallii TaxID=2827236 RepID=A0ABS6SA95_9SPHN|nr:N-acetylmuramoyl-L-alanine amidase [Pacificimonas pallii]MBV7255186.1 N-acetylmuramoyl-L-alanine amidase [Pacificimonas pallii]
MIESPSPNFDTRRADISMVVIHYTGMKSAAAALERLRDPEAKVSAHYLIAEDGTPVRLVAEESRAWHAGRAYWRGIRDVNSASIGIELANPGHDHGYVDFPEPQMAALEGLLRDILQRHDIDPRNVVGHSDIAPDRKIDPGELFPWDRFAALGLAETKPEFDYDPLWIDEGTLVAMQRFGYEIRLPKETVSAFQRRWRPGKFDGVIDAETRKILLALLKRHPPEGFILGTHLPRT